MIAGGRPGARKNEGQPGLWSRMCGKSAKGQTIACRLAGGGLGDKLARDEMAPLLFLALLFARRSLLASRFGRFLGRLLGRLGGGLLAWFGGLCARRRATAAEDFVPVV